jgi:hypothetical protein
MTSYQRKALAAQERRDDARAETRLALGKNAKNYAGNAPAFIGDRAVFNARELGWNTRMRRGTVERKKGGGLRFLPFRDSDPPVRAPSRGYGPAIGDALVGDALVSVSLVNRAASMPRPEAT